MKISTEKIIVMVYIAKYSGEDEDTHDIYRCQIPYSTQSTPLLLT